MTSSWTVYDFLTRAGTIAERARREGRSLSAIERNIIAEARNKAAEKGMSLHRCRQMEMEGERDWKTVNAKIKVALVFSYWDDMDPAAPRADFLVRESNHPALIAGGHVSVEDIVAAGQKVPSMPTYKHWIASGRKVVRA